MFGNYTISESCGAINHVCEVNAYQTKDGRDLEPSEYFTDDHSSVKDSFLYTIICVALIFSTGTLLHFIHKGSSKVWGTFYRDITLISVILLFLIFAVDYMISKDKETCLFPRWCHEGIDDQIIPAFYFYQMNECPRYSSWLTYYYEQTDTWNNGNNCESSVYGCCEVHEIGCDAFYTDGHTYSQYVSLMENYDGRWLLSVDKQDEEGSNCPTVEELIYQVSKNDKTDKNDYLVLYLSYTITTIILMCLYMVCMKCMKKEDYEKTEIDDVEKTSEKGSV